VPMSPNHAFSLAYIVFAKNPVLVQNLSAWNSVPAEQFTWTNIRVANQVCHPSPQAIFTHFSVAEGSIPPNVDVLTPTTADSANNSVTLATLIEMVQKREVDLNMRENIWHSSKKWCPYCKLQIVPKAAHMHLLAKAIKTKKKVQENH